MAWKPGESGNPNGRPPKGFALTDMLSEALDSGKSATARQRHIKRLVSAIETGRIKLRKARGKDVVEFELDRDTWLALSNWLFNRLDGKPVQRVEERVTEIPAVTADELAQAEEELREWKESESSGSNVQTQ